MPSKRFWTWSAVAILALIFVGTAVVMSVMASVVRDINDYYFPTQEIARVTSPDGKVDVVIVEQGGDATVSFSYDVYLVSKSAPIPERNNSVFKADKAQQGIRVRWLADRLLRIEYVKANIRHFTNFWYHPDTIDGSLPLYEVRISESEIPSMEFVPAS